MNNDFKSGFAIKNSEALIMHLNIISIMTNGQNIKDTLCISEN